MKTFTFKNFTENLIRVSFITSLIFSSIAYSEDSLNQHETHSLIGSHGMVLIYHPQEGLFASHMPLYRMPHDYQLIYKIQVEDTQKLINLMYKGMVTVLPELFDLSILIKGERFSINAKFFQGHFERGGINRFTAKVFFEKPVLIKRVLPNFSNEKAIIYQVKLSDNSAIFAHKIQQIPSFDAIGFTNSTRLDAGDNTLLCAKPLLLSADNIKTKLKECAQLDAKYVETKDFK